MMQHTFFSQVDGLELTPIRQVDGRHDAYCRDLILRGKDGEYLSISIHGDSEFAVMTPEERAEADMRAREYADALQGGDFSALGFDMGYVPNGDCPQEATAYSRWLERQPGGSEYMPHDLGGEG